MRPNEPAPAEGAVIQDTDFSTYSRDELLVVTSGVFVAAGPASSVSAELVWLASVGVVLLSGWWVRRGR
jgi:hypothetical protein